MNYALSLTVLGYALLGPVSLYATSVGDANASVDKKEMTKLTGTLISQQGHTYELVNLSFNKKTKHIQVFEKPSKTISSSAEKNGKTTTFRLDINPNEELAQSSLDLDEIDEISVPHPAEEWAYQQKSGGRKTQYMEINVKQNSTLSSYLIPRKTKIYGSVMHKKGPEEMEFALPAVKSLKVNYRYTVQPNPAKTETNKATPTENKPCDCDCPEKKK